MSFSKPVQGSKRKKSPGPDGGREKYQALSPGCASAPTALSLQSSFSLEHRQHPSGFSSNLPYRATAGSSSASLPMQRQTSDTSNSPYAYGFSLDHPMFEPTDLYKDLDQQAFTPRVGYPDPEFYEYGHTAHLPSHASKDNVFGEPAVSRAEGNALQHFKFENVARAGATLPPGLSDRQGTMAYPSLVSAQYTDAHPHHRSHQPVSDETHAQPLPYAAETPGPVERRSSLCLLAPCNGRDPESVYDTNEDYLIHLWEGKHFTPSDWGPARECLFDTCDSHAKTCRAKKTCPGTCLKFLTVNLWLAHVRTVHDKRFYCDREDCKLRFGAPTQKAFGTKPDLNRHVRQTHEDKVYCDKPGCTRRTNLSRKDKRDEHNIKYHGGVDGTSPYSMTAAL